MLFRSPCLAVSTLALALSGAACSVAATPPLVVDPWAGLVKQERVFRSPGGQTRVEQWVVKGEREPQVVRAQRYVSGLSLVRGVSLVFPVAEGDWMLSLNGLLTPLRSLPEGQGPVPLLAPETPVLDLYAFDHDGRRWQLAILSRQDPTPVPGIATEQEHSLDILLWRPADR